jgi:hypothetical protein
MEINRNNYETFLLLYLDRELNPSEMSDVDKFLNENADLQKEFSLLRQTVLAPPQVIFDQKELLFRKEEKRRVVPMYWIRMAAAVAVLVLGGWLMTIQLAKKHGSEIAGTDSKRKLVTNARDLSHEKTEKANNQMTDHSTMSISKVQPAVSQNMTAAKNQGAAIVRKQKNNPGYIPASAGPDLRNNSAEEDPDGSNLTMQQARVQEIQPAEIQKDVDSKQISVLPGNHAPVMLIAATGTAETVKFENAALRESEDQSDNAISVVALNDKNKAITGFFKKLTKRSPTDESTRKVRVSVFQFSY